MVNLQSEILLELSSLELIILNNLVYSLPLYAFFIRIFKSYFRNQLFSLLSSWSLGS